MTDRANHILHYFYGLYDRHRTPVLLLCTAIVASLGFLWYLPGAAHTGSMSEYHGYSFKEFRFTNIISSYTNRELRQYDRIGYIEPGIEYPALLSMLIRATAELALRGHVQAYMWVNFAIL